MGKAASDRAYNPLSVDELGRNAVRALIEYPVEVLPPTELFEGAGVYTLHYRGQFHPYAGLKENEPIYVGKADFPGRRQGRAAKTGTKTPLYSRLSKHAESIRAAENLDLEDFCCRWLVLESVWIGLTEQVLISEYRPIWNVLVDGFGNNPPGRGRTNQRRSSWDTLHPGREWAMHLRDLDKTARDIEVEIKKHHQSTSRP